MLSSETKIVTYVNKKGERSTYPLNSAMDSSNLEMVKRLKYTKDILTHMLNANMTTKNNNNKKFDKVDPTATNA
jgi:polo-like kinase 1